MKENASDGLIARYEKGTTMNEVYSIGTLY